MTLEVAEALFAIGELRREDIPTLATELLEGGTDTRTLRELAGLTEVELDRAHELFRKLMDELGHTIPSRAQAAATMARDLADLAVRPGAKLRDLAARGARLAVSAGYHEALMPFYAADDEYDLPGVFPRTDVDARLLAYAKSLAQV